jgi:hypothetical protein
VNDDPKLSNFKGTTTYEQKNMRFALVSRRINSAGLQQNDAMLYSGISLFVFFV